MTDRDRDRDQERGGAADALGWLHRVRERHAWIDHGVRAGVRYTERHGNHYAAAITYFSVLAMVPILMVAFGVLGRVLVSDQQLLAHLRTTIGRTVPPALVPLVDSVVDVAVSRGDVIGLVGLAVALYAGLGWMHNLREALSEQWDRPAGRTSMVRRWSLDLLAMLGLGLALVVSLGLAAAGSQVSEQALGWLGLREEPGADVVVLAVGLVLTLVANWLVFVWVLARLPRRPVGVRSAMRAAVIGAVGLVVLQQGMNVYLRFVTVSSAWAAFGPILGLLVFANVVSRFVLLVTAWAATAEAHEPEPAPAPAPAVVRPAVTVTRSPSPGTTAGLIGLGAAAATLGGLVARRTHRSTTTAPEPQLGGRRRADV